jgi:hypothetical protein
MQSHIRSFFGEDEYRSSLLLILLFLCAFSIYALHPKIAGDSLLYTGSIQVLQTGIQPAGFMPMMIVSTYLGLRGIMFLDFFTKSIAVSWLLLDSILYVAAGMFFYALVKRIFKDAQVAFFATLFLMTNYAAVTFGLGFLMDMGGWAFYIASLYFSYRYLENEDMSEKWLYISSLMVGIGGLYKEYAFVAYGIVFWIIVWRNWKNWKGIIKKIVLTGLIAFIPILLVNVYVYTHFNHYTYLNWFLYQKVYAYQNKVVEFIKSFGSIYNVGWFLFLGGLYMLLKQTKNIFKDKNIFFMWLVILSAFCVVLWPVVTRVLFIAMPAAVLVSCLLIEKIKNRVYVITPILVVYVWVSFLMDAYILPTVNIGSVFHFLK